MMDLFCSSAEKAAVVACLTAKWDLE